MGTTAKASAQIVTVRAIFLLFPASTLCKPFILCTKVSDLGKANEADNRKAYTKSKDLDLCSPKRLFHHAEQTVHSRNLNCESLAPLDSLYGLAVTLKGRYGAKND